MKIQLKSGQRWLRQWSSYNDRSDCILEIKDNKPIVVKIIKNYDVCLEEGKSPPARHPFNNTYLISTKIKLNNYTFTYLSGQDKQEELL